jgi:hypothetical protein
VDALELENINTNVNNTLINVDELVNNDEFYENQFYCGWGEPDVQDSANITYE